jgi:tetratricopeptide (TPR) repeat protein
MQDLDAIKKRMAKIKTELLSEVVNVGVCFLLSSGCLMTQPTQISTIRSEFDTAHHTLNKLIAHTRTHELFPLYAARITLLQAQLAHALGRTERAVKCYRVAALLAAGGEDGYEQGRDEWIRVAARAGEVWVRIGVVRRRIMKMRTRAKGDVGDATREREREREQRETDAELESLRNLGTAVCAECDVLGGTLSSIACVLRACLVKDKEYLSAKQHLRKALDLATRSEDNHLRALVMALVAAQYICTARDHAADMLDTCEQLAAGMGASDRKQKGSEKENVRQGEETMGVGNAQLRLWVGERFLGGCLLVTF